MTADVERAVPPGKVDSGNSAQMIGVMTGVGTICGLLIVIVYQLTLSAILQNQATIVKESVFEVIPGAAAQAIFGVEASGQLTPLESPEGPLPKMYAGYDGSGKLLGIAIEGSGRGYADTVRVLYTYSPEKKAIIGFKVLDSRETPGLGDKIAYDQDFLKNFESLDAKLDAAGDKLANALVTVKHGSKSQPWQIDAISGATISSRTVGKILNSSAERFVPLIEKNLDMIVKAGSK
ncbi:MAG: FMN-binding protein [Candidatus Hydrogenedentes bacterium]|nr:FMN-binding protein [Candidatus Hydrogenedentota bacterium]